MCRIPLSVLTAAPFNLILGNSIDASVTATNIYGNSDPSMVGSGGNIVYVPDAPVSFQNVPSITTASQIGLQWLNGASSGGVPIDDYRIEYD